MSRQFRTRTVTVKKTEEYEVIICDGCGVELADGDRGNGWWMVLRFFANDRNQATLCPACAEPIQKALDSGPAPWRETGDRT